MKQKPVIAIVICLVVAGLAGFFISGPFAVQTFIGLDPSAFPGGMLMQQIGEAILPALDVTLAGALLFVGVILLVFM